MVGFGDWTVEQGRTKHQNQREKPTLKNDEESRYRHPHKSTTLYRQSEFTEMVHAMDLNTLLVKDLSPIPGIIVTVRPPAAKSQGWGNFPVVMECLKEECIPSQSKSFAVYRHSSNPNTDGLTILPKFSTGEEETIPIVPSPATYHRDSFDWSTFPLILDDEERRTASYPQPRRLSMNGHGRYTTSSFGKQVDLLNEVP